MFRPVQLFNFNASVGKAYSRLYLNNFRPRQNGHHLSDDIFKCIFLKENAWISFKTSLKSVPKVRINNIPAWVQIMARRRPGLNELTSQDSETSMYEKHTTYLQHNSICISIHLLCVLNIYLDHFVVTSLDEFVILHTHTHTPFEKCPYFLKYLCSPRIMHSPSWWWNLFDQHIKPKF